MQTSICASEAEALSILYLRCLAAVARPKAGDDKQLSILYLRCSAPVSRRCTTLVLSFQFSI